MVDLFNSKDLTKKNFPFKFLIRLSLSQLGFALPAAALLIACVHELDLSAFMHYMYVLARISSQLVCVQMQCVGAYFLPAFVYRACNFDIGHACVFCEYVRPTCNC